jgi:hypothetical protein
MGNGFRTGHDLAYFKAAMGLDSRLRAPEIRWGTVVDPVGVSGGNDRRRLRRCPI